MQGSSLLTVKQVATALGIDERSVREKLQLGTLKGTKKTVGQKDQWFVHQRDLDAELVRRGQSPINQPSQVAETSPIAAEIASPPVMPQAFYQPNPTPPQAFAAPPQQPAMAHQYSFSQPPQPPEVNTAPATNFQPQAMPAPEAPAPAAPPAPEQPPQATAVMEQQTYEDVTDATIVETMADKSIFDQSAEVPTSGGTPRSWRNEDLESQVMATAEKIMKPLMDRVEELTRAVVLKDLEIEKKDLEIEEKDKQLRLLPDFEAQKKKLLAEIDAEHKAAEIQFNKVKEKEEEAKALEAENVRLKLKAEEAVLSAKKLEELENRIIELQKPKPSWWQKLWTPGTEHNSGS